MKHIAAMRFLILAALLLSACSKEPAPALRAPAGTFAGTGRNALCIAGEGNIQRAGLIVYGAGNENCSVSGKLDGSVLVPSGDSECRIPLRLEGAKVTIGAVPVACDYYCGPHQAMAGTTFTRLSESRPVIDLGGDPLC